MGEGEQKVGEGAKGGCIPSIILYKIRPHFADKKQNEQKMRMGLWLTLSVG